MLDKDKLKALAGEYGCDIRVLPETGSTNDDLKRLAADGAPAGTVVVTDKQTAGKGRLGRSFFSPESGVYLSLLLRPGDDAVKALGCTTAAAVAVCRAVERVCGRKAEIKWVNDVYVDGRKVCGILTEGSVSGGRLEWAVVGIGTNLTPPVGGFPEEIADRAGALFETGHAPEDISERYAAELIRQLCGCLSLDGTVSADVMEDYRRRSFIVGRDIVAITHDGEKPCRAVSITDDAELIVEYPDGSRETLYSGEVSVRI